MGAGSLPASPAIPAGATAEERERAWAAAHPPVVQGQPVGSSATQQQQQNQQYHADQQNIYTQPQQQQYQAPQQSSFPQGAAMSSGLYPNPVAGIPVRGTDETCFLLLAVFRLNAKVETATRVVMVIDQQHF